MDWVVVDAECICVVDLGIKHYNDYRNMGNILPMLHQKYTIREIYIMDSKVGFTLKEIVNPKMHFAQQFHELMFLPTLFQPIIRKSFEEDIKIFEKLLDKAPALV
jgi:hypothetical protein